MTLAIEDIKQAVKLLGYAERHLYIKDKVKASRELEMLCRRLNNIVNDLEEQ